MVQGGATHEKWQEQEIESARSTERPDTQKVARTDDHANADDSRPDAGHGHNRRRQDQDANKPGDTNRHNTHDRRDKDDTEYAAGRNDTEKDAKDDTEYTAGRDDTENDAKKDNGKRAYDAADGANEDDTTGYDTGKTDDKTDDAGDESSGWDDAGEKNDTKDNARERHATSRVNKERMPTGHEQQRDEQRRKQRVHTTMHPVHAQSSRCRNGALQERGSDRTAGGSNKAQPADTRDGGKVRQDNRPVRSDVRHSRS